MSFKKILLLLLAVCMVIPTLAACKKDPAGTENETQENVNLFEDDDNNPNLDPIDGQGREFRVLARIYNDSYLFKYSEVEDTGEEGEPVNAAVVKRNQAIESKYNVGFIITKKNPSEIVPALDKDAKAGLHSYDMATPIMNTAILAGCNGLLTEWGQIPFVNETKDYWMGELYDRTTIGGYHFYCPGDLNISAYNTVQVVFFNKQMHKNLELDNIYDLVKADQWTVEAMTAMAKTAGKDVNGESGTVDGTYGLVSAVMVWEPLFYNTGLTLITKDEDDLPSMSALDNNKEFLFNTIEDIVKLMNDKNTAGITSQIGFMGPEKFRSGGALFWVECLYGQFELTNLTTDYGIIPIPTWNAGDEFIANTHSGFSTVSCVPLGVSDPELTGSILEDMAYYSQQIVIPEYYEKTIHLRGVRDSESYEMLDIIFEHIVVDLALVMSSLTIGSDIRDILGNNAVDTIASRLSGNKDLYEGMIKDIVKTFCSAGAKQYGYQ